MGFVTWYEAISYGFSMFGYFFVVGSVSGWLLLSGMDYISDTGELFLGWIMVGFGFVVAISGSYGAMYKMIADGVGRGLTNIRWDVKETASHSNDDNDSITLD